MKYFFTTILKSSKRVFKNRKYRITFLPLTLLLLIFFVLIPVLSIPSNTLSLQFSLYSLADYAILSITALLTSLFILMNIHHFQFSRTGQQNASLLVKGSIGSSSGVIASLFGAASCPMCIASLFGFLGFGTVGLLVEYQLWFFLGALAFLLFSLYSVSSKIIGNCSQCSL